MNLVLPTHPSQEQVARDLAEYIRGGPESVCVVEFVAVHVQRLLHAAIEGIVDVDPDISPGRPECIIFRSLKQ